MNDIQMTLKGERNGKTVTIEVYGRVNSENLIHVHKAKGKIFGTQTGYFRPLSRELTSYRGKTLLENVERVA